MKCRSVSIKRYGIVLASAVLSCAAGCQGTGGWKMPSMFGSREPDAGKLAGNTAVPPSPAGKYTPSAIASKTPPATTNQTAQAGSLPYGGSSTASYSATAPKGGLAAQANGYQTGPYTTNTSATQMPSGTTQMPSGTASLASGSTGGNGTLGYTSPYGGTYNGVSTATASAPNLNQVSGQLPTNNLATSAPPQSFSPTASTLPTNGVPAVPTNLTAGTTSAYPQNQSSYGSNSLPTDPSSYSMPAVPNINGLPTATAVANALPTSKPAVSAYQSNVPSGTYAPGSTGRSNTYNFGSLQQPPASSSAPQYSLPPNTASGENLLIR